jgi:hypothetical protein
MFMPGDIDADASVMHPNRRLSLLVLAASFVVLSSSLAGCSSVQPSGVSATAGDGSALVYFTDGAAGQEYQVAVLPGFAAFRTQYSPASITGLENGTAYTFAVRAKGYNGHWSEWSEPSAPVVPQGKPGAPTISSVAGFVDLSGCTAKVKFTPGSDGGAPITGYEVAVSEDVAPVRGTTSPIAVPGLQVHKTYGFTIRAFNARGASAVSTTFTGTCS